MSGGAVRTVAEILEEVAKKTGRTQADRAVEFGDD
jgi:hypothetical protein